MLYSACPCLQFGNNIDLFNRFAFFIPEVVLPPSMIIIDLFFFEVSMRLKCVRFRKYRFKLWDRILADKHTREGKYKNILKTT